MDNQSSRYPSIEEYRKLGKKDTTDVLVRLIGDEKLVEWIVGEVGYDPTPQEYVSKSDWESTKSLAPMPDTEQTIRREGWADIMPKTRHDCYVLREILQRTQGYGYSERHELESTDTSRLISWMCRHNNGEYWKDKAQSVFVNNAQARDDIASISMKSLDELTGLIKNEIESQDLKEETVKRWDFFYEKTFDKVVYPPDITEKINWEEVADYFLLSASIPTGANVAYYKTKYI